MSRLPMTRRLVTVALVLLAIGSLLLAYAVVARRSAEQAGTAAPQTSRVLLDESFDSGLDETVFNTCHWWADGGCTIASNDELEWYLPEQVTVADGQLRLTATEKAVRGTDGEPYDFRSGMVTTGPPPRSEDDVPAKLAFTYGTVEARLKTPAGRGLWPALWLLPADRESRPEIDVLEVLGDDPGTTVMHLHPRDRGAESPSKEYRVPGASFAEDWHTVRLNWAPERLEFFVDGVRVWRVTGDQVPDEPMYVLINLAVGGVYPGPPDASTVFPATFAIDHLRITGA